MKCEASFNEFDNFINTEARMLDSFFRMKLKLFEIIFFE